MTNLIADFSTLVFDVGGTLLKLNYDALAHAYVNTAAQLDIVLDWNATRRIVEQLESEIPVWQQKRAVSLEHDNGREFWNDFYTEGFRRLGVTQDVSTAANEIRERFQHAEFEMLFEDVVPTLDALVQRGLPMGILSNFSVNLENVLRQVGVHRYFQFFIVSAVAGIEKPDPLIFDLTARAANRPLKEIVYIGDSLYHDIEGARQAGLAAILLDRRNRYPEFNGMKISSLRELI